MMVNSLLLALFGGTCVKLYVDSTNSFVTISLDQTASYTVGSLNCANSIGLTNATSSSISANKMLSLVQNGDAYGTSYFNLSNGNGALGAEIKTTSSTILISELWFTTAATPATRIIRNESRVGAAVCGVPSLHMGGSSILVPSFAIGDSYCAVGQQLVVGTYTPLQRISSML